MNNYLIPIWRNKRFLLNNALYTLYLYLGLYRRYHNIDWTRVNRLIFVCKGNICRSPYAEFKSCKLGLKTSSVGIEADGKSGANEMAIKISSQRGINIDTHTSRRVEHIKYSESDLIVCMEPYLANIILNCHNEHCANCQITLLGLWCSRKRALIRDPYGQSINIFSNCFDLIDDALSNIHEILVQ